jgi:hypothetical protein
VKEMKAGHRTNQKKAEVLLDQVEQAAIEWAFERWSNHLTIRQSKCQ